MSANVAPPKTTPTNEKPILNARIIAQRIMRSKKKAGNRRNGPATR